MQYNGQEIYSIGQNEIPMNIRIDWAWEVIAKTHPEFKRENWPPDWNDPYQIYEIVVNNVCGYIPQAGAQVMDIGANFGVFTSYCALKGCDVVAYEPHPVAIRMLKETLERNKIQDKVEIVSKAIYTHAGSLPFTNSSGYEVNATWLWNNGTLMTPSANLNVDTISLDEALAQKPEWDCVKMDIEGAEFDVLESVSLDMLKRVKLLSVEFHNSHADKDRHDKISNAIKPSVFIGRNKGWFSRVCKTRALDINVCNEALAWSWVKKFQFVFKPVRFCLIQIPMLLTGAISLSGIIFLLATYIY